LVGRRPHDGFGLLEIATGGGLGEAARLPSILPPPQPRDRHEDDRAHQADQDEIDSEDQQHPEPHLGHCLTCRRPRRALTARIPSAVRSNHARDLLSRSGNSVASITRLLGVVSRSTISKYVPELTDGRQPAILEAAPTATTSPNLTS
jgi:hypothetical protein